MGLYLLELELTFIRFSHKKLNTRKKSVHLCEKKMVKNARNFNETFFLSLRVLFH